MKKTLITLLTLSSAALAVEQGSTYKVRDWRDLGHVIMVPVHVNAQNPTVNDLYRATAKELNKPINTILMIHQKPNRESSALSYYISQDDTGKLVENTTPLSSLGIESGATLGAIPRLAGNPAFTTDIE